MSMYLTKRRAVVTAWAFIALAAAPSSLVAQRTGSTPPAFKGIWEPVSFTEDITLWDVFFVNVDVGWAAGDKGTIIHTKDGGQTWTAQLGGDPNARGESIEKLHFLDERHGWAVWHSKLLRTVDGESWEEVSTIDLSTRDIAFVSPTEGFRAAGAPGVGSVHSSIYRTTDGGKTWKEAWQCDVRVAMGGLNRSLKCRIEQLHFPTPQIGYGVARGTTISTNGPPLLVKTEDGGASWAPVTGPGDTESDYLTSVFFLDAQTGFVRDGDGKLSKTTDGGATWRGLVASRPGKLIRFADPNVGWTVDPRTQSDIAFTSDGGARWGTRSVVFPASVRSFSMPRRDRVFVVGDNGMVFRYRVVPSSHQLRKDDIAMAAMPGFDTPLDEQVAQLEQAVTTVGTSLGATASAAAADSILLDSLAAVPYDTPLPPTSEYVSSCCAQSASRLEVILGALAQSLPEFVGRYRNLNLLVAGMRMGAELPAQARAVKSGIRAFRQAKDKNEAAAALATVMSALSTLKTTTAVSMQQQLPPPQ